MARRAPDKEAIEELRKALAAVKESLGENPSPTIIRRMRNALGDVAVELEEVRAATDPIAMPRAVFDPGDPNAIGRMVSIALLAQERVPLAEVAPAYGAGVYAIYYRGDHPLYAAISGTETPIYVGKADPAKGVAGNPREQGDKLTGRLMEHAKTIATVERYSNQLPQGLSPISLADFDCRRLVCATNAQLVAERHLIGTFWPLWNSDTKACWGMSKHGDSADTRGNKRSPWDVVHPGRSWALPAKLVDSMSPDEIKEKIDKVLAATPPHKSHADLLEKMLEGFRQGAVPEDKLVSPLGEDAPGPDPEEAGGEDDE
ncbi:Eco29kI family restriction endonuclease [Bradyrhizobium diazoefficiens]|uniref:Eco29kI family restriction endonuclease n=1 Tax=Bradyrhizobium diazoefficiens TaxID=1355477 RepID=UPI0004AC6C72|nr:Eco29kI family restriction endonuclease [Bradyrhizobium diazoefficiens]